MKICPQCTTGYPDRETCCPTHGSTLSEIRELKPGMIVHKTYRIVRKLGQGGMGAVYLAEHTLMNEPRALKFLSPDLSADRDFTNRFLREVRTLRQVRNTNVVDCGDLESAEDDSLFFAMEYVDGPDLGTFLRNAPQPFDVALALRFTRSIADGLGAAHAKGMVHRDIKPENILMARDGESWVPKIADFGIVATRDLNTYTQTGALLLTPYYAAPEQWRGMRASELDCRTDIYALGGVLYEMLTGQKALNAHDYHGWAQQHLTVEPQAPSSLRLDLASWKGLDTLVLSMMAKDRERRPQNVVELQSLLDRVVYVPPPPRGQKASSRVHAWAWGSLIAIVLIAILAVPRILRSHLSKPLNGTSLQRTTPVAVPNQYKDEVPGAAPVAPAKAPSFVAPSAPKDQTPHSESKLRQDTRSAVSNADPQIKQEMKPAESGGSIPPVQETRSPQEQKSAQSEAVPAGTPKSDASQQAKLPLVEASKPAKRETSIYDIQEKAKELFDSGAYSDARPLFEEACNGGSGEACNYLGIIFTKGDGVKIDNVQAAVFYSHACSVEYVAGCSSLGAMYLDGVGVHADYGKALTLNNKGCDAGNMMGCDNLGVMYARGAGVPRDLQRAFDLYSKACDGGMAHGCSNLGQLFLQGRGVRKDVDKGKELLKKGCSMGDRRGCDWLRETR
jgi:serine/threonine protein kinase